MRFAWLGLALLLLTLPASSVAQSATDDLLIVPGQRIGPLAVGMSIVDATKIFGTPHPAITKLTSVVLPVPDGATAFEWALSPEAQRQGAGARDGFVVITDKAGMIYEVQGPFDNRYHTSEGIHVGSKASDVTKMLGEASRQVTFGHERGYVYDQRGIAVFIQDTRMAPNYGQVNDIWVFTPRLAP